ARQRTRRAPFCCLSTLSSSLAGASPTSAAPGPRSTPRSGPACTGCRALRATSARSAAPC
ncbi:hypothetical protein IWQ56_001203, partial [Coemansia nantahalensis]